MPAAARRPLLRVTAIASITTLAAAAAVRRHAEHGDAVGPDCGRAPQPGDREARGGKTVYGLITGDLSIANAPRDGSRAGGLRLRGPRAQPTGFPGAQRLS
jgi:hypothetical protein